MSLKHRAALPQKEPNQPTEAHSADLPPSVESSPLSQDGLSRVTIQGAEAPPESTSTLRSDYFPFICAKNRPHQTEIT